MTKRSALSIPGIYTITNTTNGKVYVGQSTNIRIRWMNHRAALRDGKHRNMYLQNAWNKQGAEAFVFAVHTDLSGTEPSVLAAALNLAEITLLASISEPYNLMEAGNSGTIAGPETREIWSQQRIKMWSDPAFRAQRSAETKALYANPEWKAARDAAVKEGLNTPEVKAAISVHFTAMWADPDHKAAQSAKRIANWQDPDYVAKQKASRQASWADPESRARRIAGLKGAAARPEVLAARKAGIESVRGQISASQRARFADPEQRKAQSDRLKASWARRKAKTEAAD